jgi:hypothetical protein
MALVWAQWRALLDLLLSPVRAACLVQRRQLAELKLKGWLLSPARLRIHLGLLAW